MNCPKCQIELKISKVKDLLIHQCHTCKGVWFEGDEFKETVEKKDPFLRLTNLDLWKEDGKHSLKNSSDTCPDCREFMFEVHYAGTSIHPKVCLDCHGVWMAEKQLDKIIKYLETELDSQSLKDLLKLLGHEAVGILSHENIGTQLKETKIVFKLIGYRLFSQFPFLDRLSENLPKP